MRNRPVVICTRIGGILAALTMAGCGGSTAGTPVAISMSTSAESPTQSATTTPSLDVSPPTTAIPNPAVSGTTFDGCASVTTTDEIAWELTPSSKKDISDKGGPMGSETARGCFWNVNKWQIRIYAFNGSLPQWTQRYGERYDRMDHRQFGSRDGVVAHQAPPLAGCTVVIPSQQGLAAVAVVPSYDLEKQGFDACPLASKIMTTIEPRIP